jgi:hypothetical protein
MSAQELLAALVEELPALVRVEPYACLDDELLPSSLTPVEPTAFTLACCKLSGARTDHATKGLRVTNRRGGLR